MANKIIEVEHVTKEYELGHMQSIKENASNLLKRIIGRDAVSREIFKALDDINFSVEVGEVLGIIGHNGAGKSTLLKLLANISRPSRGKISVKGTVAPLIEVGAGFNPELSGRENIFLNAAILGMPMKVIKRRLDEIVAFAELEQFIDTPVKRYSSGMAVRLGFSLATSVDADILIVDEVLAVGDIAFQQKCIERMEMLIKREGKTVLIVGHNIRQLERICSRVMLLDHGKITQDGNPQEVCGLFFREAQDRTFTRHKKTGIEFQPDQDAGVVKIRKIELLDGDGLLTEKIGMHEPLSIKITFECLKAIQRPEIVVGLHTSDFVHIVSVSNALPNVRPDLSVGTHQIICRMEDIPLRPSSYSLRLAFIDQHRQMLWYGENIVPVKVVPGKYDITRMPEVGLIDVPTTWSFLHNV